MFHTPEEKIEDRMYKYLKECAKAEGNPVFRSRSQLAIELNVSPSSISVAERILQAQGKVTKDISNFQKPKYIVN